MRVEEIGKISSEPVKFDLSSNFALLLVHSGDDEHHCFRLWNDSGSSQGEELLKQLNSVTDVRFLGATGVWESFCSVQLGWHKKVSRSVKKNSGEVWYLPAEGIVRFEKQETTDKVLSPAEPGQKTSKTPVPQAVGVKKSVLIVDDSPVVQKLISKVVEQSRFLEVAGVAGSAAEAKKLIEKQKPDLITLDIHMPEMNGVDFLKQYLKNTKIPVVMISSVSVAEGPLVMEALSNGAVTYIQKPSIEDLSEIESDIVSSLEQIANAKPMHETSVNPSESWFVDKKGLIAFGASTGGTHALQEILTAMPREIPPIVIVQHIPSVFSSAFADRLNNLCPFTVKEASNYEKLMPNCVYIAPGGKQLRVKKREDYLVARVTDDAPVNRFKPSVDYLFQSLVDVADQVRVATILTGMGYDGAEGLLQLKHKGVTTLAQSEDSCVVFGMPREAILKGAATSIVHLSQIAKAVIENYNKSAEKASA